jgi:hypothetical protein
MLPADFKISSFLPPGISTIGGKTYVCPGWHEVPEGTTLDEVYERWTRINYGVEEKNTHKPIKEIVTSSKGDKTYTVLYNNGAWDCDCAGFGFRRKCRHIEEIKTKHKMT